MSLPRCGACGLVLRGRGKRPGGWPFGYCRCGLPPAGASATLYEARRMLRAWPTDRRPLWQRALEARAAASTAP